MRTVLQVEVVIETPDSTVPAEHDKRVGWAKQNLLQSQQYMRGGTYVVTVIRDEAGKLLTFSGHGDAPSGETTDLIDELTEEKGTT